jgi:cell division protein FtsL
MRMSQSLAQFERAFREETVYEAKRRERLRHEAAKRSVRRRHERVVRTGKVRYIGLITTILVTTIAVTVLMFRMLALWFS